MSIQAHDLHENDAVAAAGRGACLIAVDIGTTRSKALLYRFDQGLVSMSSCGYGTSHPKPGYAEQDAAEVLEAVFRAVADLVQSQDLAPGSVEALSFAGIWQSLLPLDREGRPLSRALTWADTRALAESRALRARLDAEQVAARTGCGLHPMYFLPRLLWLRDTAPEILGRTSKLVSIKEYVLYHLFGCFAVDRSIASGTGIWNMATREWDRELLSEIGLDVGLFSPIYEPTHTLAGLLPEAATRMGLLPGTPGVIGAADGALSHLGGCALRPERLSVTVGTGAGLRRLVSGPTLIPGGEAWCYYLAEEQWLLGGIVQSAGNVVTWFADTFLGREGEDPEVYRKIDRYAGEIPPGADGLRILPYLAGERCPRERPESRGAVYGLAFSHTLKHLARATLEGISYVLYTVYRMLAQEGSFEIVLTGGLAASEVWIQLTADLFQQRLLVPKVSETSAWGAVLIALRALGTLDSLDQAERFVEIGHEVAPDPIAAETYAELRRSLDRLYGRLYEGAEEDLAPNA
jgi:gluconokinase